MQISEVKSKLYKCQNCGLEKQLVTNHYGECYGQAALRMNMCEGCSWKRPTECVIWECQEAPTHQLKRDDVVLFQGTENECLYKLHGIQPQSWDHALRYEGYKIEEIKIAE